ncbi:MAG: FAD-dependent oxidoreductase [Myxococcota bacterium]
MSTQYRIDDHPILPTTEAPSVRFTFNGKELLARRGEAISSALYAAGISTFGHHHRDGGAQGIFCVNGQCSQCTVLVDGRPLKSCMTLVKEGMVVESCEGSPSLPADDGVGVMGRPGEERVQVLILGGGPAGLCAAVELGRLGVEVLIIDDKPELGGKLTLQTHQFFGSVDDCWAGTRGIEIGRILEREVRALPTVKVWLNSTAVGVFCDGKVGVVTPDGYRLVEAGSLLVALGAREKSLSFPGCDLPGVYGAGAFQTLVNRDLIKACSRLFVIGGGNVGLIGAYHALQAGIDVVGLVEALPEVGGYKVHADKIRRLGVPIWTRTTVTRADRTPGKESIGSVTIADIDDRFQPIEGTERTFEVDTLLIAVGLSPVDELLAKAQELGIKAYSAGDTAEIAEASAAIFSGRITGRQIARDLGIPVEIPSYWPELAGILRSRPGKTEPFVAKDLDQPVYPVIRCVQEIPCNPCQQACPEKLISMPGSIMALPEFSGKCLGCGECVTVCPGLAINLVFNDYDPTGNKALLMLPFEFSLDRVPLGSDVDTVDLDGNPVGKGVVIAVRSREQQDRRHLLLVEVPAEDKLAVAGFTIRGPSMPVELELEDDASDPIVCRCERVRKSAIVAEIQAGVRDINQLKALARVSMGGCGGKTCTDLVRRIFREEGVSPGEVTAGTVRPLVAETPLGAFVRGQEADHD